MERFGDVRHEDRRLFERFPSRYPAKVQDGRDHFGLLMNLRDASAQGVKISTKQQLFVHDIINLEVSLPDGQDAMRLKGQVMWTKLVEPHLWDVGLKFPSIHLMHISRLYKFVAPI